jgi:cytochrome b pre-mRNA-processing protein 3
MLKFWNRKANHARRDAALALYGDVARQAREPKLYTTLGVPDTFDGRFDALALYVALMLWRLRGQGADSDALAKELSSLFVADMDRTIREIGVGDLSVGKHVKRMASAMLGRMEAYGAALSGEPVADDPANALEEALVRNIWRGNQPGDDMAAELAQYIRDFWAVLSAVPLEKLLAGKLSSGNASGEREGAENGI